MYATFVAADLHSKARCKLAYGSALISRGPRCMQACSGELRSAIRSVIEQCTASHVSIVASKRRVGHILSYLMEQYFSLSLFISRSVFIWFYLPPPARVRTLFTYTRSINAVRHLNSRQAIHAKHKRRQASKRRQAIHAKPKQPSGYTLRLRLYTPYTAAASINGHTASPIGSLYGSSHPDGLSLSSSPSIPLRICP